MFGAGLSSVLLNWNKLKTIEIISPGVSGHIVMTMVSLFPYPEPPCPPESIMNPLQVLNVWLLLAGDIGIFIWENALPANASISRIKKFFIINQVYFVFRGLVVKAFVISGIA